jgi:arylsulfatase A-like enzyme
MPGGNPYTNPGRQGARIATFEKRNPQIVTTVTEDLKFKYNNILIVCDQLINFKNVPEKILNIMPGYQAFKRLGIQFNNIYNNRQDCSPSRGSFCTSQLNINISDNIDQPWQYDYNPELNTSFDTIGKSLKRNGFETVWYGKNHFVSDIATSVNTVPIFNTNTRGCLKEYGYDIFNTFGDSYYSSNEGMFADNIVFDLKVNYKNNNVDFVDSAGKYIGAIPYLKARSRNDKAFHLELHLENPHDTQHFWQNFAQQPTKPQLQFWAPYINEQIALLKTLYPDREIYDPYNFSNSFRDAYIQNPNLVTNYFEKTFLTYVENSDSLPFEESYLRDYVLDPSSNNSQFPYYVAMMESLKGNTTIPNSKQDIMSWKNLINNYYGLLLEIDNYIFRLFLLLRDQNMLNTTSVTIISDHGDMMSSHGLKQKGFPFENSCNIACLIYSPYIPFRLRGTTSDVLGSLLDIAPTIETLANIKINKSNKFLGKSLLNWTVDNYLVPRVENEPVFNVYNSWMTYLTYFNYKSWITDNSNNTVLENFNPSNFFEYQSFFTMIVDNIDGKKYKLARYFNFIELLEYNWLFNSKLLLLNLTASIIKNNFSSDLNEIPMFKSDIDYAKNLIDEYFITNNWNFNLYYKYIINKTGINDNLMKILLLIPIINITISNIGFSYKMPGYYDDSYTFLNKFLDYYDSSNNNYYYFMYNLTDDPNEMTNLLDKGYPERQLIPNVLTTAALLNDKLNLIIDKYKIVYFDFIVPKKIFISIALNFKIQSNLTSLNAYIYNSCFRLNKPDGDNKTPYYDNTLEMLKQLKS